ncbi:hypothetical protein BDN72DRAFT_893009 [Pluteus cervinus]|uniref:Uncharacterized protein n=1 Tax=Pluteus cervinus TaxID=181527 RepID=A0ACD3B937_9AGAR|nr:hypothetical protein BDN72DRAFT_893009 [Pluteus cervinus]
MLGASSSNDAPTRHEEYYFEVIIFLVEDTLFRVPRYAFEESPIFHDMFSLPVSTSVHDGQSDEQPLHLQGILHTDFEQLLRVMYPLQPRKTPSLEKEEWISVLKLSTMWEFHSMRALAITQLTALLYGDPTGRFVLARQYKVKEWFTSAANELVRRAHPINFEEAQLIGFDIALKLAALRERPVQLNHHGREFVTFRGAKAFDYVATITQSVLKEEYSEVSDYDRQ